MPGAIVDCPACHVKAGDRTRPQVARDVGTPTAATATDFQHVAPGHFDTTREMVVELNAEPVGFILPKQDRRRSAVDPGKPVVHEDHFVLLVEAGNVLVPDADRNPAQAGRDPVDQVRNPVKLQPSQPGLHGAFVPRLLSGRHAQLYLPFLPAQRQRAGRHLPSRASARV